MKAKPRAAPRKGAVQGVASTVAKTPLKKAPAGPCLAAKPPAAPTTRPLRLTSNRPKRFKAISVTSVVSPTRNSGLPNCMPNRLCVRRPARDDQAPAQQEKSDQHAQGVNQPQHPHPPRLVSALADKAQDL